MAAMVVGEGGKALLAQFLPRHSSLAISNVTRQASSNFVVRAPPPPRPSVAVVVVPAAAASGSRESTSRREPSRAPRFQLALIGCVNVSLCLPPCLSAFLPNSVLPSCCYTCSLPRAWP